MHNLKFFEGFFLFHWVWVSYTDTWSFLDPTETLTPKHCEAVGWADTRWALLCHAARAGLITVRRPKARFTVNYWTGALRPLTVTLAIGAWHKSSDRMVSVLQSRISPGELWKETQRKAANFELWAGSSLFGDVLAQIRFVVFLPVTVWWSSRSHVLHWGEKVFSILQPIIPQITCPHWHTFFIKETKNIFFSKYTLPDVA